MLSIRLTISIIFLVWGVSLLVEAQECSTFTSPDNTRWLDADVNGQGSTFKCKEGYRTMAQPSCVNGEWNINPVCTEVDICRKIQCPDNTTCVDGTCVCPIGRYGKYCKGCDVMEGYVMSYGGIIINLPGLDDEACAKKCSESPACTTSVVRKDCLLFTHPTVDIQNFTNINECIQACYDHPSCTGFNFMDSQKNYNTTTCVMFNTTAGLDYILYEAPEVYDASTSERNCEDLFTEDSSM